VFDNELGPWAYLWPENVEQFTAIRRSAKLEAVANVERRKIFLKLSTGEDKIDTGLQVHKALFDFPWIAIPIDIHVSGSSVMSNPCSDLEGEL
jgi:hypothetical protein